MTVGLVHLMLLRKEPGPGVMDIDLISTTGTPVQLQQVTIPRIVSRLHQIPMDDGRMKIVMPQE